MKQPPTLGLKPSSPVEVQDRLTLVLQLTYESAGEKPLAVRSAGDLLLQTTGGAACQPPKVTAAEEWTPIDTGWIKADRLGLLVVHNLEPQRPARRAYAQKVPVSDKALLVCLASADGKPDPEQAFRVEPGLALPFAPNSTQPVWIRSVNGQVAYRVTAIPV